MAFFHIRKLREQNFFRLAIFGKMLADKARFTHNLHGLMCFFQICLIVFDFLCSYLAFAKKIVIVKGKA